MEETSRLVAVSVLPRDTVASGAAEFLIGASDLPLCAEACA
jgi:hypothetical protein